MLKVLIVDDEMLVRVGIKSTIEWEKHGCTVVAEAANGEEALQKIETYCPHILLTDIRMPKMDGLELLREIERRELEIETVIMSSYNEFELVREAMKLGASDYLLKLSFTEDELIAVIEKIRKKIEKRKKPDTENFFSQSDFRHKLFQKLTDPLITQEQRERLAENLELCINLKNPAFAILMTDHSYETEIMGYQYPDEQRRKMMLNLLEEQLRSRKQGEVFAIDDDKGIYAAFLSSGLDLNETARYITNKVKDYFKLSCSAYIFPDGTVEQCPDYVNYGLGQLENRRFLMGGEQTCIFEGIPEKSDLSAGRSALSRENASFSGDISEISGLSGLTEKIQKLTGKMKASGLAAGECRRILTECVYKVLPAFRSAGGTLKGMEEYCGIDVLKNMQSLETIEHVICWFQDFETAADAYLAECIKGQKRGEIGAAIQFIQENYSQPLKLADAAEQAGLSAAYFSTVFKKETGKSFSEYLTDLRVERAKELLGDRDVRIYEICEIVGYPDPNYFSKIFRKAVGMSPEKYRKQITGGDN